MEATPELGPVHFWSPKSSSFSGSYVMRQPPDIDGRHCMFLITVCMCVMCVDVY